MDNFFQVAVNFPKTNSILTYKGDASFNEGDMVVVPLGRREGQGLVLRHSTQEETGQFDHSKIKAINGHIESSFSLSQLDIELYQWMSKYYHYPLGKLVFDCLPKVMKRPRPPKFVEGKGEEFPFALTDDQSVAFEAMKKHTQFSQHYLHGVTGSGKSLVYLKLMQEALARGKSVQFLLPEINLTPQFVKLFENHLSCKILSYHSAVTASEKYNIWKFLHESTEPVLLMGVRSSLFLPVQNLGLIIVDEEHDTSFKQSDRCPYHARDVGVKKAQLADCPIVLGSATPTVENYYLFKKLGQNRHYYTLPYRVGEGNIPKMKLLDIRGHFGEDDPTWPLMPESLQKIQERLDKKEQVLVFINKLGFSNFIQCRSCGHRFINENCGCENNLRYFKNKNLLSCAHCDYKERVPDQCPECGSISLSNKGYGTEKVHEVLEKHFPNARVDRFDRDEITNFKQLNEKLDSFHNGEIDILVGTQMLAKGHNFEKVNLVIVLGIDQMLGYADFRSTEKAFQLLQQVSGRAGRFSDESEVLIQTMSVEHELFKTIAQNPFDGIYENELMLRELCSCPPFSRICMIYFSSRFRDRAISCIQDVASKLRELIDRHKLEVQLLGPTPLSIEKKAHQFTWAIMLKAQNVNALHQVAFSFTENYQDVSGVSVKLDMDPQHIL